MKLMTKEIADNLPVLGETYMIPLEDKIVMIKYFLPMRNWTWYVVEGEKKDDGDWHFWGLVHGLEREWGYFTLSELQNIGKSCLLGVERDLWFDHPPIGLVLKRYVA